MPDEDRMQLIFTWIGKTKNPHLAALEQEYLERLGHFVACRCQIVRPEVARTERDQWRRREAEGQKILALLPVDSYVVVLDERGEMLRSEELAEMVKRCLQEGTRQMHFVVGSHSGLSEAVRGRANKLLSLSRMTMPHELVRVILLEQVYRAFAIIHRLPYPK